MRKLFSAAIAAGLVSLSVASAVEASMLYGVEFAGSTPLFDVNQATGLATVIGPSGFDGVGDLTSDTRITSPTVWGIRMASNELLEFNTTTGAATVAATLNSPDSMVSLAFDPVGHKLYGNTSLGFGAPFDALYEIDPGTGNSTFIGRITFDNVYALGFAQDGKLYGVSDDTNQLILIDTATGNGSLIATLQVSEAFDIASRPEDGVMFLTDSGSDRLWRLDVTNGNLNDVGPHVSSTNIVGLAFSAVPEPASASLAVAAGLALLARRRRAARPQ
jgi:hypothetical protein